MKQHNKNSFRLCGNIPTEYNRLRYALMLLLLIGLLPHSSFGQGRLKGAKFFQAGLGFRGAGPNVSAYGGMTFSPTIKGMVGGGAGLGKQADINYKYFFLDGIGSFTTKSVNRLFYFNLQAGLSLNGDLINAFETENYDKKFSFNYGVLGGIEAEFQATRNLEFVLSANQRYYIKKDFGNWRYHVTAAMRFTF
jgi:hypothetical protein